VNFSSIALSTFVLIILPSLLVISNVLLRNYYSSSVLEYSVYYFQIAVSIVMLLLYPLSSVVELKEDRLTNEDCKKLVSEYEYVKKIIYILLPFFLLYIISFLSGNLLFDFAGPQDTGSETANTITVIAQAFLYFSIASLFAVTSALLRVILLLAKKNFQFYLAKGCFDISFEKEDNKVDRVKYLLKGLYFYNKYLKRNLGLQINDLENICYNIIVKILHDSEGKSSVYQAFKSGDGLDPIEHLSGYQKEKNKPFMVKNSLVERIKQWIGILSTLVSILGGLFGIAVMLIPSFPK